jgi:hypothetical protein
MICLHTDDCTQLCNTYDSQNPMLMLISLEQEVYNYIRSQPVKITAYSILLVPFPHAYEHHHI